MAKKSRDKGKRGEGEVQDMLERFLIDYSREQDGRNQPCDFRFLGVRAEVRRREQVRIDAWANEIEAKTPDGELPVTVYRKNGEPWRANLLAEDFLRLLVAARIGSEAWPK